MNVVALTGRLTADVEVKQTPQGTSVVNFSIAVSRDYKDGEGNYPVDFINCVAWKHTADFISRFFNKGDMIALQGCIQTRNYTDKDGNKRYLTEVLVEKANFCGGKSNNAKPPQQTPSQPANNNTFTGNLEGFEEIPSNGEIPF